MDRQQIYRGVEVMSWMRSATQMNSIFTCFNIDKGHTVDQQKSGPNQFCPKLSHVM